MSLNSVGDGSDEALPEGVNDRLYMGQDVDILPTVELRKYRLAEITPDLTIAYLLMESSETYHKKIADMECKAHIDSLDLSPHIKHLNLAQYTDFLELTSSEDLIELTPPTDIIKSNRHRNYRAPWVVFGGQVVDNTITPYKTGKTPYVNVQSLEPHYVDKVITYFLDTHGVEINNIN